MYYAIRVHESEHATRASIAAHFRSYDGAVFIVRETEAERPHYQGIVCSERTLDTIRKRLKTAFKCVGNEQYGVSKLRDYDKSVRYFCKGPEKRRGNLPDIVCQQSIDIDVEVSHNAYWDENEKLKKRSKTENSKCLIEEVVEHFKDRWVGNSHSGRYEVCRYIVEAMKERNRGMTSFQVRGVYNTVMCRLDGGFQDSFIDEIISKY